jgi:hypothetical protein
MGLLVFLEIILQAFTMDNVGHRMGISSTEKVGVLGVGF